LSLFALALAEDNAASCTNYKELLQNSYSALEGTRGNQDYTNADLIYYVFAVSFQWGINESDEFRSDLRALYTVATQFSDALPNITNDKSALLIEFSDSGDVANKVIALIQDNPKKFEDQGTLSKACAYIQNGKEIVDNLTKEVLQCIAAFRVTQIPDGKPTFERIYNVIIEYLKVFQADVQKVDGNIDQSIKDKLRKFLASDLQPLIDDAGLNEPLKEYYSCDSDKFSQASEKLSTLSNDLTQTIN